MHELENARRQWKTLSQLAKLPELEINGRAASVPKLWRWCREGVRRRSDGVRLFLAHSFVGGVLVSTEANVVDFLNEINGRPIGTATHRQRMDQIEAAEAELDALGVA